LVVSRQLDRGRLVGWTILVSALALLGYASRASGGKPPANAAYQYTTAIGGVVQYAVILTIVLLIARPEWRRLLALRKPTSYTRAVTTTLGVLAVVYVISAIVSAFSHPGNEQGLTPDKWDPHRITPYAVNFVLFVAVAPFVEELTFRGLGYSLLEPLGRTPAILWVGVAFGLAHGLLEALPILIAFGAGLALIRARTDSVYPGMFVHGLFNAIALIVSVTT
jgi:CAAX protease family protein